MLPNNYNQPNNSAEVRNAQSSMPTLRVSDVILILVSNWYWIILCLLLSWGVAELIIRTSRPVYTRSASILIKDSRGGNNGNVDISMFNDMNGLIKETDINNEIFMLKSPTVMTEVIHRLDLQMDYEMQGTLRRLTLYGSTLPLNVQMMDASDLDECEVTINCQNDSTLLLTGFKQGGQLLEKPDMRVKVGEVVQTPLGSLRIEKTSYWYHFGHPIIVAHHRLQSTLSLYSDKLTVSAQNASSIINIETRDYDIQRAEDILYSLIAIYNEQWMDDRNQISVSTNEFINERLQVIESELGNVEDNISDYKAEHLIAGDAEAVANMYMSQAQSAQTQITELNNQLYIARSVRGYLTSEQSFSQLLPSSSGLENGAITSQIQQYNTLLLRRNNLVSASSLQNPIVQDLDNQLSVLRRTLINTIDTHIGEINMLIKSARGVQAQGNSRVAASPSQTKYLLSVERQQKVKESLYLYLLQKREENELSQAFTAYNSRVVTPPSGKNTPTAPVKRNIYFICLLVGLLLPIGLLLLNEIANTSVRGRKDLDVLNIPFLGEIPLMNPGSKLSRSWKAFKNWVDTRRNGRIKEDKTLHLVVKPDSTNVINEAFRVIRTNMEFVAGRSDAGARVIMLTSFNPNSGKTFVVCNLAMALSYKKKRVLVVDLDMRKRSLSSLVGKHSPGLSNYLGGYIDDFHDVIKPVPELPELHVLPAGKIPPNPTELLYESRLDTLLKSLRSEYDYIFFDCPPLEIVADATIVSRLADMTIFVVRAEALQRTALADVQKYYDENRLPKMTILLNGTTDAFSRYGYHRYGSRYGYSYGYGRSYSYGYGYGKESDKDDEVKS